MKNWIRKKIASSKLFKMFVKFMAVLNTAEGLLHLVFAFIGLWGCIATGVWDARILAPIIENFVFGIFSILTGLVLGNMGHHHHHDIDLEKIEREID